MDSILHSQDLEMAGQAAKKIRADGPEAVAEFYEDYRLLVESFVRHRLDRPSQEKIAAVHQAFLDELKNPRTLEYYTGEVSLRAYLLEICHRHCADANRRDADESLNLSPEQTEKIYSGQMTDQEKALLEKQQAALGQALTWLTRIDPMDARLAWMHLSGQSVEQMADRLVEAREGPGEDAAEKILWIQDRLHEPRTGVLARLSMLLERTMEANGLDRQNAQPQEVAS